MSLISRRRGQVVVRFAAAGVNPYDTTCVRERMPLSSASYTPGSDAAGTVRPWAKGWKAWCGRPRFVGALSGAYAEQTLAEAWQVHPLPPNVSFNQGAALNVPYTPRPIAPVANWACATGGDGFGPRASGGVGVAGVQWTEPPE